MATPDILAQLEIDRSGRIQCPFCEWRIGPEVFFDHQKHEHDLRKPGEFVDTVIEWFGADAFDKGVSPTS